jgi:AraC-like DNA-binding protein
VQQQQNANQDPVANLLSAGERVLGLRLCFHPRPYRRHWPERWITHADPACLAVKAHHQDRCAAHCGLAVPRDLAGTGEATLVTCPFGHTELVCPFTAGLLFAGPIWNGAGDPPRAGLRVPPDAGWLADRRELLLAITRRLAELVASGPGAGGERRRLILAWCHRHLPATPRLTDLAAELGLTPSRAGHAVRECFGLTFPALVHDCRLREAAHLLRTSSLPLVEIALRFGYHDQSHFTRRFVRRFGITPGRYRRQR